MLIGIFKWDHTGDFFGNIPPSGNKLVYLGTPLDEIREKLPLGHQLYVDYIEKILTEPDKKFIESLFN